MFLLCPLISLNLNGNTFCFKLKIYLNTKAFLEFKYWLKHSLFNYLRTGRRTGTDIYEVLIKSNYNTLLKNAMF